MLVEGGDVGLLVEGGTSGGRVGCSSTVTGAVESKGDDGFVCIVDGLLLARYCNAH